MSPNNIPRAFVLSILMLSLFSPLLSNNASADYPNVGVIISGPTELAVDSSTSYAITVTGGPAEVGSGWWKYEAYLEMDNRTGQPDVTPNTGNSTNNVFRFNVTAPSAEQIITLVVTGYSATEEASKSEIRRYQIRIVKPVVLSATVSNNGRVAVLGVPVVFYADQVEVARVTVDLQPGETKQVSTNWTSYVSSLYTITVKVDPDGMFMDVQLGDNVLSEDAYVGERSNLFTWLYGAILVILAIFAVLLILSAKQTRRPMTSNKWK